MGFAPPTDASCGVVTEREGRIVELNAAAADLLNIRPKGLDRYPRTFEMFFDSSRPAILTAQAAATSTPSEPMAALLRPRGRRARAVIITVHEATDGYLEWTINPSGTTRTEESPSHGQTSSPRH